jgi:hypothetical protein
MITDSDLEQIWKETTETSVKIAYPRAQIWTPDLPNTGRVSE